MRGQGLLNWGWLVFLLMLFGHFWLKRRTLLAAQSWLKVKGHVLVCQWTQAGARMWPKIEYSYRVYDKNLVGEYLFLDTIHNSPSSKYARSIAYKVAVAFEKGEEIDIYYNPNQPDQSALDVSIPKKLNFILIFLACLIILQLGLLAWTYLE